MLKNCKTAPSVKPPEKVVVLSKQFFVEKFKAFMVSNTVNLTKSVISFNDFFLECKILEGSLCFSGKFVLEKNTFVNENCK